MSQYPDWLPANMIEHWTPWRTDNRNGWPPNTTTEQIEFWRHAARLGVNIGRYTEPPVFFNPDDFRLTPDEVPPTDYPAVEVPAAEPSDDMAALMEQETGMPAPFWRGVMEVETGGVALTGDGFPICRFELKQWKRLLSEEAWDQARWFFRGENTWQGGDDEVDVNGEWQSIHGSQAFRRTVIAFASTFGDRDVAYQATSWGLFQLMGWHYVLTDYDTAEAMAAAFREPEAQARGYLTWLQARGGLAALAEGELRRFVEIHNGDGDIVNVADKIDRAARRNGWQGFTS